jgi:Sulfotransferase family
MAESSCGDNLVCIVGCPRSGTTWVQRLLAGHPRVRTGQESDVFDIYVGPQLRAWRRELDPAASGRGGVGLACYFDDPTFKHVLRGYASALMQPMLGGLAAGEIFVEKTPSHALYIPEILELFPKTRFVHVLRDARDTVASLLGAARTWGKGWAPRRARGAGLMWVSHVTAVRAARLRADQVHEVRYEDLHADGPRVLGELVGWLGLDWSEAEVQTAVRANQPEVARGGGGTPIPLGGAFGARFGSVVQEPPGFVRKAQVGTWRDDLSPLERLLVWRVAGRTMAEVGYPWPRPWQ